MKTRISSEPATALASLSTPIYGFQKNPTMVDYEGYLSVVFFTSGCNFRCGFCHNATLMGRQQKHLSWDALRRGCEKYQSEWVNAAVISGGEPTLSSGLPELVQYFHSLGWRVKLDTNGSNPDVLQTVIHDVDYVAMDIKSDQDGYVELVGFDKIDRIEASIQLIMAHAADYEFRTTVLTDHHSERVMRGCVQLIEEAKRYVLQAFVPRDELPVKRYRTLPRTERKTLDYLATIAKPYVQEVVVRG